ncbi:MAG: penicillin-binding protein 2 [Tissierellia bacterium]|nr:penicillin-binding protein 2 [Tissierellia bacterium]
MKNDRRRILLVLIGLITLSLSLIVYLTLFVVFKADDIKYHSANRRSGIKESQILRGTIYDRNGEILAYSDGEPGNFRRHYNYPRIYSHIIGYSNPSLGKAGLESSYNSYLLSQDGNKTWKSLKELMNEDNKVGNNIVLTLDTTLQNRTRELLEETELKGAAVVLNPKTGEIYSMVSLPDYDSSTITEDWSDISASKDGILVNRAISGLYPPGSTFKTVTSVAILEDKNLDLSYVDEGTQKIGARVFKNANPDEINGKIGIREAFAESLNTYFVSKGVEVGQEKLGNVADRFMFNKKVSFDLPLKTSKFDHSKKLDNIQIAASSIGQGQVLATPLEMAMVAGAIANEGQMMAPYIVREVETNNGVTVKEHKPEVLSEVTNQEVAAEVKELMKRVITHGIGSNAYISGMKVAGKTGSAENASGKNHAWFIGFAPADDPKFAVAVVLEEADQPGGKIAAPIARDLIISANKHINIPSTN